MSVTYILDGKTPIKCDDYTEWLAWWETVNGDPQNLNVQEDMVGDVKVSTRFLALDCSFGKGDPHLFETRLSGGAHGKKDIVRRYATWEEAEAGHAKVLKMVKERQS